MPPSPSVLRQLRAAGLDVRVIDSPEGYKLFLTGVPEHYAAQAQLFIDRSLSAGADENPAQQPGGGHPPSSGTLIQGVYPATFFLIAALVLIHIWLSLGFSDISAWMIVDPRWWPDLELDQRLDALSELLRSGRLFNLLSPALIHFSSSHLAMNLIALYVLGGPLERALGPVRFVASCVMLALLSNLAQALAGPFSFGGFSGVNYGLLGMVWVLRTSAKADLFARIPPAMIYFSIIFALAGAVGLTDAMGLNMADTAHFSGLLAGVVLGWAVREKKGAKGPE
ncbi:MAG: rhomboid family intramembrane serine protease [Gammaproteobacteria bacterium]|nr:MAG: rhomboid family intramembrane serine protease [Gammaproteobacteria bacterium]